MGVTEQQVFQALLQTSPGAAEHVAEVTGAYQRRVVGTDDRGRPIGEGHHRAKLTDHEIDLIIELRAQGMLLEVIAQKFEISKSYACEICAGKKRVGMAVGQTVVWRWVPSNGMEKG